MAVPKIRFPGFTEDWEQRKLGDILQYEQPQKYIVSSTNYDDSFEIPVLTAGQTFILGYTNESEGVKEASPNKPVIIFDDFTTSSHYVDFPFKIKSSAMKLLTLTNERDNIYFAFEALQNLNYVPQNHERHWISIFSDFDISIPSYGEQQKIGALFKEIDSTITLHQRKLESMKLLKKSLLQKMFPKSGETVPEVRFPGFTDAWEQRKLGEISEKVTTKNQDMVVNEVFTNSAEYGIISQQDFFDKDIANSNKVDGYYLVEPDDFVYNPRISNSAPFGPIKRNKLGRSGAMSPLYYVFRSHDVDKSYLDWFFQTNRWHAFMRFHGNTGVRSDRFAITDKIFAEMTISIPQDIDEQKAIGTFFTALDDSITLHQRKVESLQKLKKSLLQQMFV